jgi:hypothetical protein
MKSMGSLDTNDETKMVNNETSECVNDRQNGAQGREASQSSVTASEEMRIQELKTQLVELSKVQLEPVGEAFGPLLFELQRLLDRQGRRGADGFTKFVVQKLGLALSTAYDWIGKHKVRIGILAPKPKPFPKLGKGGRGKKGPAPAYNQEDLEKFESTAYVRQLSLFTFEEAAEIIAMCEDEDLQQFLGAVDKYDCAFKAVQFVYTQAKAKARTPSSGTPKEDRPPDVEGGLLPSTVAAI